VAKKIRCMTCGYVNEIPKKVITPGGNPPRCVNCGHEGFPVTGSQQADISKSPSPQHKTRKF